MTQAIQNFTELLRMRFLARQAKASGITENMADSSDKFSLEKAIAILNEYKELDAFGFYKVQKELYNLETRIAFMSMTDERKRSWMDIIANGLE